MQIPIFTLEGSPRQMGEQFGEACKQEVSEIYHKHMEWIITLTAQAGRPIVLDQILAVAKECLKIAKSFAPQAIEELNGLAHSTGFMPEQLLVVSSLTDVIDLLVFSGVAHKLGCSSAIAAPDSTNNGKLLMGQTFDWLTDDLPYVCLVNRKPDNGPEIWSLNLKGCLLGLPGGILNSEGIAIGVTNLLTWDSCLGVLRVALIYKASFCKTLDEVVACITKASRSGAHYFYAGDSNGRAIGMECSATKHALFPCDSGIFAHCNHALDNEIKKFENAPPDESTCWRQERLTQLLTKRNSKITVECLKTMFADREGGELAIRQENTLGIYNSNASVIMSPMNGEIHVCRGPADIGKWVTKSF